MKATRQEAAKAGDSHYFTGKPCKHGHICRRRTKDANCVECVKIKSLKRYYNDQERFCNAAKARYHADPAPRKDKVAEYRSKNADSIRRKRHEHWARNKKSITEKHTQYVKRRRAYDPVFAAKMRIRSLIGNCLRCRGFKKSSATAKILGCSWEQLRIHIERQFLAGMTWDNMGEWHIDHITPMATAKTVEDAIALNHVSNLRPIWGSENLAKRDQVQFLI